MRLTVPSAAGPTVVEVVYPAGNIGLRGTPPLSWEETRKPTRVEGDVHLFELEVPRGEICELKVVRDENESWASGPNYAIHPGDRVRIEPAFERATCRLDGPHDIDGVHCEVLLPPTFDEQTNKRYPVCFALDGQALFSTSSDPFGVWNLDHAIDALLAVQAIEEIVIVGIHTAEGRLESLSPVADPAHGGGKAGELLAKIVDSVRPWARDTFRTDEASILGSSMGGLFAFHAAMSRPDVFKKAACLSSSFWWSHRWAVRWVQTHGVPQDKPLLYLDSGAAPDPMEPDPQIRDGFHHTRSMVRALVAEGYRLGVDLHRMVFAGQGHEPAAWGSRIGIPLQLLYPSRAGG
jgi:predicted alpha/beta superfamily hydrolase